MLARKVTEDYFLQQLYNVDDYGDHSANSTSMLMAILR